MARTWTFGRKLGLGFAALVLVLGVVSVVAILALRGVVAAKDEVIHRDSVGLTLATELRGQSWASSSDSRAYLFTRDPHFLDQLAADREDRKRTQEQLRAELYTEEGRRLLDQAVALWQQHQALVDRAVAMRQADAPLEEVARFFTTEVAPKRDEIDKALLALVSQKQGILDQHVRTSTQKAANAMWVLGGAAVAGVILAILLAVFLTRTLTRQIAGAIQHVQTSSAELQAAASQQASGAKQQTTAVTEITTTISELLATSRQIAESAQRVAHIAGETAGTARGGDQSVKRAADSLGGIKSQVDLIVSSMLDLGRKSQQIGGILEIINELSEQTNILSINASIEAAGAGEAGRRFAVVAEEIRKLADRVGGSTKEIRTLIDEIRAAVNTTVMVTEGGTKAVEAGTRQFGEVAAAFQSIAAAVVTASEAAREIELSTKQQASAVEQVNGAIQNVAQASKESESSTTQTYQTAAQLSGLSRNLTDLIQPRADA